MFEQFPEMVENLPFYEACAALRWDILYTCAVLTRLRDAGNISEDGNPGETRANLQLAVRALEDAKMRIGCAAAANGDSKSLAQFERTLQPEQDIEDVAQRLKRVESVFISIADDACALRSDGSCDLADAKCLIDGIIDDYFTLFPDKVLRCHAGLKENEEDKTEEAAACSSIPKVVWKKKSYEEEGAEFAINGAFDYADPGIDAVAYKKEVEPTPERIAEIEKENARKAERRVFEFEWTLRHIIACKNAATSLASQGIVNDYDKLLAQVLEEACNVLRKPYDEV